LTDPKPSSTNQERDERIVPFLFSGIDTILDFLFGASFMSVRPIFASVCLALSLCFGCGGSGGPVTETVAIQSRLGEVAELYRTYSAMSKKPPKSLADLRTIENVAPSGLTPLVTGEVVVYWGAELPDLGEEPTGPESDKVLAYEKDVPEKGGQVLMLDRRIKTMTAEAFAAAPKAGTADAEAPAKKKS